MSEPEPSKKGKEEEEEEETKPGFKFRIGVRKVYPWVLAGAGFGAVSFGCMDIFWRIMEKLSPTIREKLLKVSPADRIYLCSKAGSSVHAFCAGAWPVKLIFWDKVWQKDVVKPYPASLDIFFGMHFGYTIFEIVLFIIRKEPLSMWFHHVVDAYGSFLISCFREAGFFPTLFGATEITVVPQNMIHYYQILKIEKPQLLKFLIVLRFVSYLIFRTFVGPFSAAYSLTGNRLTWQAFKNVNVIVTICSLFNVASLSYLNWDWTKLCYRAMMKTLKN